MNQPLTADQQLLVEKNIALAFYLARVSHARCGRTRDLDELESGAQLALCVAAQRFDAARGVPFGAYASRGIWQALWSIIRRGAKKTVKVVSLAVIVDEADGFDISDQKMPGVPDAASYRVECDEALACLTPEQRRLVYEHFGKSVFLSDLGNQLGISASEVRVQLDKAVDKVRRFRSGSRCHAHTV